jgi:hypothetical protein
LSLVVGVEVGQPARAREAATKSKAENRRTDRAGMSGDSAKLAREEHRLPAY